MTMNDYEGIKRKDAEGTIMLMIEGLNGDRKKELVEKYYDDDARMNVRAQKILLGDWMHNAVQMLTRGATPDEMHKVVEYIYVILNSIKCKLNVQKAYIDNNMLELLAKYVKKHKPVRLKENGIKQSEKRKLIMEMADESHKKLVEQVKYAKEKGQTCTQIAFELGLAESTVRNLLKE